VDDALLVFAAFFGDWLSSWRLLFVSEVVASVIVAIFGADVPFFEPDVRFSFADVPLILADVRFFAADVLFSSLKPGARTNLSRSCIQSAASCSSCGGQNMVSAPAGAFGTISEISHRSTTSPTSAKTFAGGFECSIRMFSMLSNRKSRGLLPVSICGRCTFARQRPASTLDLILFQSWTLVCIHCFCIY